MSILIRGMELPTKCSECNFCVNGFTDAAPVWECACEATEFSSSLVNDKGKPLDFRPDWCPLIEIPTPHGRLIDADKIDYRNYAMHDGKGNLVVDDNFVNGIVWANNCIDMTPTIIEAEGSEE